MDKDIGTNRKTYGYSMLSLALLINSGLTVAFKFASNISYIQLLFFISMIGTTTSAFFMFAKGTQGEVKYYFTHPKPFALMVMWSVLVYTLLELILGYTTHYVSASLSAVVYRTYPLMVIAMTSFILRERLSKWGVTGVVIGFSGLASIIVLNGGPRISWTTLPFIGLLLFGAFFDAICSSISKRYYYDMSSSVFMYNILSFAIFLSLAILTGNLTLSGISTIDWVAILFRGVFQNVLLTYAFVGSFRLTNTATASNLLLLTPFITVVISYIMLREAVLTSYFFVAATVATGAIIQFLDSHKSTCITKNKGEGYPIYDVTSVFVGTKDRRLYEMMRGEGRVLALVIPKGKVELKKREEELIGKKSIVEDCPREEDRCIFFTLGSDDIVFGKGDIDFITDLTRLKRQEDLIFFMTGIPNKDYDQFQIIYEKLKGLSPLR